MYMSLNDQYIVFPNLQAYMYSFCIPFDGALPELKINHYVSFLIGRLHCNQFICCVC